jgi:hypothetical protein
MCTTDVKTATKAFGALSPPLLAVAADTQLWPLGIELVADDVFVCDLCNAPLPSHLLAALLVGMGNG